MEHIDVSNLSLATLLSSADRWAAIIRSYDELRADDNLIYRIFS